MTDDRDERGCDVLAAGGEGEVDVWIEIRKRQHLCGSAEPAKSEDGVLRIEEGGRIGGRGCGRRGRKGLAGDTLAGAKGSCVDVVELILRRRRWTYSGGGAEEKRRNEGFLWAVCESFGIHGGERIGVEVRSGGVVDDANCGDECELWIVLDHVSGWECRWVCKAVEHVTKQCTVGCRAGAVLRSEIVTEAG